MPDLPPFVPLLQPPDTAGTSRWYWVRGGTVAVSAEAPPSDWSPHFLGLRGDVACWAVEPPEGHEGPEDTTFVDLYRLFGAVDEQEWAIAGRAVQLIAWARTHRYCGACGEPTEATAGERAMRCPGCGLLAFPRLAPAVITLVHRGDAVLLARGVTFPLPMYSCIAGFVEPGETLEQAVAREVFEEVGVMVDDVRYVASQPWPFPHSLMLGFTARWVGGDIEIDPKEIVDAAWWTRDDLPPIPSGISIARTLIDRWCRGELPEPR
jgi:NAD+ diphosphatase